MVVTDERLSKILHHFNRSSLIEVNPNSKKFRIIDTSNDVICAFNRMGGIEQGAKLLNISISEVNSWIDKHYVPEPFASIIRKHTGFSILSIQESSFYVYDGFNYWPHRPTQEQLHRHTGIGIYCLSLKSVR